MPWNATLPARVERAHAFVVAARAGAADRDHGVGAARRFSAASSAYRAVALRCDAALGLDRAGDQRGRGADDRAAAGAHHAQARLADRHALDAERQQRRDIDAAQPRAGHLQHGARRCIGAGRQHAFAGRDGGERLHRLPCIDTASSAATASVSAGIRSPVSMRGGAGDSGSGV